MSTSYFDSRLAVYEVGDGIWVTSRPLILSSQRLGVEIKVPEGFETDFASVPRIFWSIFPPFGLYTRAAVVHDYLYRNTSFKRGTCDKVFREAMQILKVPAWKKETMYVMVVFFGQGTWDNYRRKQNED